MTRVALERRRRFEILLPDRYNDGRAIMHECMECVPKTLMDVLNRFGALSYNPHSIQGVWTHEGTRYEDRLFRLTVDTEDNAASFEFIHHLKSELEARFDQLEIYVVSFSICVH
ncbi:MAG TPA: hypothetical protein VFQ61_36840 [Polyangiaceae bacterium]|nr:hypothetical protein [Polyangiaceae bacterium]